MRRRLTLDEKEAAIEFIPATILEPLSFADLFVRDAPVEIDIGCGDGTFLAALATQNSARNFLGIERLAGRVRSVCRKAARLQLANLRVLRIDAAYALKELIPAGSVFAIHLLFPDPWPKRRHHRRRTVTPDFLAAIHRALANDGRLHLATDHEDYFYSIRRLVSDSALFERSHEAMEFPRSRFEQNFAANGAPIYRLVLRKISPVE